jgi:hypothetical protein
MEECITQEPEEGDDQQKKKWPTIDAGQGLPVVVERVNEESERALSVETLLGETNGVDHPGAGKKKNGKSAAPPVKFFQVCHSPAK